MKLTKVDKQIIDELLNECRDLTIAYNNSIDEKYKIQYEDYHMLYAGLKDRIEYLKQLNYKLNQ